MNRPFAERGEFDDLLDRFVEGGLRPMENTRFNDLLGSHSEYQLLYLAYVGLHSALEWDLAERPATSPRAATDLPATGAVADAFQKTQPPSINSVPVSGLEPTRKTIVVGFLESAISLSASWLSSPKVLALTVAGFLGAYFVGLMISIAISRTAAPDRISTNLSRDPVEPRRDGRDIPANSGPGTNSLAADAQARWSKETAPADAVVRIGRRYELLDGRVEVVLARGAQVVIEGPATWLLESDQRLKFDAGKLTARIPKAAIGFTVATPLAEVIDLGTEFGVEVDLSGKTDIHVLRGEVKVKAASVRFPSAPQDQDVRIRAGSALRVDSKQATFTSIPINLKWRTDFANEPKKPFVVALQNATADFSQDNFPVSKTIDGVTSEGNAWAVFPELGSGHTAVWETAADLGGVAGTKLTFTMPMLLGSQHTIGQFRLSVTNESRFNFADGLASGGDVTAAWTTLAPLSVTDTDGATFTINGDNSVTVSGANPGTDTYTVTATTALAGITGFRLETLVNADRTSEPGLGPGRSAPGGNFGLSEFQVQAETPTTPRSIGD